MTTIEVVGLGALNMDYLYKVERILKMKPTACFINSTRAGITGEEALYTAFTHGYIAGAGLDVVEGESLSLDRP